MIYKIIAKIVGPYLPDDYLIAGMHIVKENFEQKEEDVSPTTKVKVSNEKSVQCGISFNSHKFPHKKFDSSHLIRLEIEQDHDNPHKAYDLAKIKIQQLIESLTIASFNIKKVRKGIERSRDLNDIYQYQIMGIYAQEDGDQKKIKVDDLGTSWNYFPEEFSSDLDLLTKEILACNDATLRKAMRYMKRAKTFSFEYYSDLEVFLNSMKCIELFTKKFYAEGLRKSNGKFVTFFDKVEGFDGNPGLFDILDIEEKYRKITLEAWRCRNELDMAHASEYSLIAFPFPFDVNKTAYHFLMKYILHLKVTDPNCFYTISELDEDWWDMFR